MKSFPLLWIFLLDCNLSLALVATPPSNNYKDQHLSNRRDVIQDILTSTSTITASSILLPYLSSSPAMAAESTTTSTTIPITNASNNLASKLAKRDPTVLKNSVFNIPPSAQTYPSFLHGRWKVQSKFRGFLFPSTSIPKTTLTSNPLIPGFQKCSIASICDVGKEFTEYEMQINPNTNLEDKAFNLQQVIDANLGYKAVQNVIYDSKSNPNRISIEFVKNKTRNAERVELFCNAREAQYIPAVANTSSSTQDSSSSSSTSNLFVCSEYFRQVTFSLSQEFGVARQVNGNYAHFWTWRETVSENGEKMLKGNVLTAAYLDPQDAMFMEEPTKPVVIYSQDLMAQKIG